ncbi:hypothetical protein RJ639_032275 [Escallonia herrerae]|uniref:ABC-2 type transporter transmembrane domain-containing protein n=1 Tax=Escallonia herrerae TaxID=1293975 RepID=A0AA88WW14_9ASTE|nr:hypothetical protein RJ639_032275 [Escallonia herrerae]
MSHVIDSGCNDEMANFDDFEKEVSRGEEDAARWNSYVRDASIKLASHMPVFMANSLVLFLSFATPNYIALSCLVTVLHTSFFLFFGCFIAKDSMPKYWVFMHYFSMCKYGVTTCFLKSYTGSFCPVCFHVYDDDHLPPHQNNLHQPL